MKKMHVVVLAMNRAQNQKTRGFSELPLINVTGVAYYLFQLDPGYIEYKICYIHT